ncbi:hypothetical protein GCM10020254_14700 [Streptomyces goshikiensis]
MHCPAALPRGVMSASTTDRAASQRPRLGRDFSQLWWSAAVSSLGDGATIAAAPLLATRLTDDPRLIGAASVAVTIPFILFGIPAGLLVDRLDIRTMMVRVDIARAVLLAVLALGILGGWGGLPLLYVCMFLLGVGEVLSRNAAQVLVPFITPQAGLATANARIMAAQEAGTGFIGPLLGALMFGVAVAPAVRRGRRHLPVLRRTGQPHPRHPADRARTGQGRRAVGDAGRRQVALLAPPVAQPRPDLLPDQPGRERDARRARGVQRQGTPPGPVRVRRPARLPGRRGRRVLTVRPPPSPNVWAGRVRWSPPPC